jgi:hypothetical protein
VTNGKVVYDSSDIFGKVWYTVEGFKRVVVGYSNTDARGAVFGGAVVGWLLESAQGEGVNDLLESLQKSTRTASPDLPQEISPADGADGVRFGGGSRSVAVVLVVAVSILVFWLVYRTLNRVRMRRT